MLDLRQRKKTLTILTVLDLDNNMTSHGQKVTVIGKYHWYKPRVCKLWLLGHIWLVWL